MGMDAKTAAAIVDMQLAPWRQAIADPQSAQLAVLQRLVKDYAQTGDGKLHGAEHIDTLADYRRAYPIRDYETYKPLIEKVMAGDTALLLAEEPIGWAITRGTTKGESKFVPMTPKDLFMRISAGRAMLNFVAQSGQYELFNGVNLNLNFPSVVGTVQAGERQLEYGYSSGIYTKHVSKFTPIVSTPTQEEIDELGGGKSEADWDRRFELAYQKCKEQNVVLVGGVCPTALRFGRFLRRAHRVYPKDLWQTKVMTLGSVAGINTYYQPGLNALYGPAAIREIYGATEGMFGQQLDEKRAWTPNYDLFFFEVESGGKVKLLHEMQPGESGDLVVSTPIFPRYRIGDLVRAFEPPYFRCIGRTKWSTPLQYAWREFASFNLGRL